MRANLAERRLCTPLTFLKNEKKRQAKEAYVISFIEAFDNNLDKAKNEVLRSLALDYCPEASMVAAILFAKQHDFAKALDLLEQGKAFIEKKAKDLGRESLPPEYFETSLFRARVLDLMGKREEALKQYHDLSVSPDLEDANLRRLAVLKKPYTKKKLATILMPYSSYIALS